MNVLQLMKITFLLSAWSAQAINSNRKVSGKDCEPILSSVRMEVSPTLLRVMCRTTNSTTLVVDCGTNFRYERVAGLCSNSDLNIGKVSMSQPLLSSTITLQLVQSGQILDDAKVALLSSEQLFNYRISVWGNKNTRFVLEIAKECRHSSNVDLIDTIIGVNNSVPVKSSQRLPVVRANSQSLQPSHEFQQSHPQSPVNGDDTPLISENSLPKKLKNAQKTDRAILRSRYGFLNAQKIQQTRKDNASIVDNSKNNESYRSKSLKPSLVKTPSLKNFRFHYNKKDSEKNIPTTPAAESSELAKLRWMEEKRIIFEKKMKFLRNFIPETDDTTHNDTENLSQEEDEEPTESSSPRLSKSSERLPSFDLHRSNNAHGDATKHNKDLSVPHAFRGVQIRPTDKYNDIAQDQSRSTEIKPPPTNKAATTKMRHKEQKVRLLGSSNVSVQQNNDAKSSRLIPASRHIPAPRLIPASRLSNQPIVAKESSAVLPPVITLESTTINKPKRIHMINAKPDNTKSDLLEFNHTSAGVHKTAANYTGVHKTVANHTGVHKTVANYTGVHKTFANYTGVHKTVANHTGVHKTFANYTGVHKTVANHTGVHKTVANYTGVHKTVANYTGVHKTVANYTGVHKTVANNTGYKAPSIVLTQPLSPSEKWVQTAQTLSRSVDNIAAKSTLPHIPTSLINSTNPVVKFFKSLKSVENVTSTPKTITISSSLQRLNNSQYKQSVTVSNTEVEIGKTVFKELGLLTTVPVTVRTVRFEKPSQLQSMVPGNPQKSIRRTRKRVFKTSAFKTTTDGRTSAKTLSTTSPTPFTRPTPHALTDKTPTSNVNNLSDKSTTQQQTSFITPPANSTYKQLNKSNKAGVKTSSADTSLRTIINSSSSPPEGHTDPSSSLALPSYLRSEPRKVIFSNVQKPLMESRSWNTNASHLPAAAQNEPKHKYRIRETNINETTTTSQIKTNKTSVFMTEKIKRAPVIVADREFEGPLLKDVQTPSNLPEVVHRNTSVQQKQENETVSQSPQVVNTSASTVDVQTSTTVAIDHPQTIESHLEVPETSQDPSNTGTSQDPTNTRTSQDPTNTGTSQDPTNTGTSQDSTNTGTSQPTDKGLEDMERDSFWPIAAALVIGIPTVIVLAIAIAVIHRKRLEKTAQLTRLEVATASLDPIA